VNETELFLTPLLEVIERAVAIAQETLSETDGPRVEKAYQDQTERMLVGLDMTMDELDKLGAPTTWIGRMVERVQDWWLDKTAALTDRDGDADEDELALIFFMPIPVLQTCPLQETPLEYDEVDEKMAAAASEIMAAITQRTDWQPVPFQQPEPYFESDFDNPMEQVLGVWKTREDDGFLVLIDSFQEDPKLMGNAIGLVHLVGKPGADFAARLQ